MQETKHHIAGYKYPDLPNRVMRFSKHYRGTVQKRLELTPISTHSWWRVHRGERVSLAVQEAIKAFLDENEGADPSFVAKKVTGYEKDGIPAPLQPYVLYRADTTSADSIEVFPGELKWSDEEGMAYLSCKEEGDGNVLLSVLKPPFSDFIMLRGADWGWSSLYVINAGSPQSGKFARLGLALILDQLKAEVETSSPILTPVALAPQPAEPIASYKKLKRGEEEFAAAEALLTAAVHDNLMVTSVLERFAMPGKINGGAQRPS